MNFAAHIARHKKISCPCRNCKHKNMFDVDVVRHHLTHLGCLNITELGFFMGKLSLQQLLLKVQESLNQYGDFHGMLHDLYPMHDMALDTMDQGPYVQHAAKGPTMQQPIEDPNDDAKSFINK